MDVAGNQHHADKSQVEQWRDAAGIEFLSEPVGIETGISRMRDFLRSPFNGLSRLTIHPQCEGLLWELSEGEQYPKDQAGNPIKENPIDAHNHARKALSYLLVNAYGPSDFAPERKPQPGGNPFSKPTDGPGIDIVRKPDGRITFEQPKPKSQRAGGGLSFGSQSK